MVYIVEVVNIADVAYIVDAKGEAREGRTEIVLLNRYNQILGTSLSYAFG